jgi:hypothetical protein
MAEVTPELLAERLDHIEAELRELRTDFANLQKLALRMERHIMQLKDSFAGLNGRLEKLEART